MRASSTFRELLQSYRERSESALRRWLPKPGIQPSRLHEAMRYAVLNGGKRVRPVLTYATGEALGAHVDTLDGPACAVEMIHGYSLVHDDLPAMDDDDLRRGKPTCHRAYDEGIALLVGDALQSLAFYVLSHDGNMIKDSALRLEMIENLALAAGSRGMAGGQAIDLAAVGETLNLAELENMHIHKTGALLRASVKLGALSAPQTPPQVIERLDHYAKCVGLAFQVHDDVLDLESDTATLGKTQGSDLARNKPTYPALVGLSRAKQIAEELHEQALESIKDLDDRAAPLRWLSAYIVGRQH